MEVWASLTAVTTDCHGAKHYEAGYTLVRKQPKLTQNTQTSDALSQLFGVGLPEQCDSSCLAKQAVIDKTVLHPI